jgi:threonine/homoserine/homoserine lactone efflux protein
VPTLQTLLLFMTAGLALNLTPGPDMLYVATRSVSEGRAAGLVSALGIAAGCLVHLAALALGLAALLARIPEAYEAVRLIGAAYLIYLGARSLFRPRGLTPGAEPARATLVAIFRQGVITNVLNPKVALFFLAFLPQFVDPVRGSPVAQIVLLGLLFNCSGTLVNAAVAIMASRATGWLRSQEVASRRLQRLTGVVFLALGARLAWARRA